MLIEIDKTCKECNIKFESYEFVLRHLRCHKTTAKEYVLKWKYGNQVPLCACGCNRENRWNVALKDFTRFIRGHHAYGRVKSDEEKAKIGKKNSVNMKKFMERHPDIAKKRIREMLPLSKTPEAIKKQSESIHRFWAESPLAPVLREEASQRAIALLAENKIGPHAPFKRETLISPWTGEEEHMHSSWESIFFQSCIARQYEVTKNHGIVIPYKHPNGTQRNYIPDFYACEDRTLYEVKGRRNEVDEAKWSAAQEYCDRMGWGFVVMLSPEI
jgi:hypothetical protein